jgi:hypothetical protein
MPTMQAGLLTTAPCALLIGFIRWEHAHPDFIQTGGTDNGFHAL